MRERDGFSTAERKKKVINGRKGSKKKKTKVRADEGKVRQAA